MTNQTKQTQFIDYDVLAGVEDLVNRLEKRGINFTVFRKWMKDNKVIAAGSYILQTLIKEEWSESDFDVYVLGDSKKDLEKCANNYEPPPNSKLLKEVSTYQYQTSDIIRVTEWAVGDEKNPLIVQIMSINPFEYDDLKKFIDLYDLDFCKVIFDGDKVEVMYPYSVRTKISIYNRLYSGDNHVDIERKLRWNNRKKTRTLKYEKRGFTIFG